MSSARNELLLFLWDFDYKLMMSRHDSHVASVYHRQSLALLLLLLLLYVVLYAKEGRLEQPAAKTL